VTIEVPGKEVITLWLKATSLAELSVTDVGRVPCVSTAIPVVYVPPTGTVILVGIDN
jgi:hypothetical protein